MDRGDLLSLVVGLGIVLILAVAYPALTAPESGDPEPTEVPPGVPVTPPVTTAPATGVFRIDYVDDFFSYPCYRLPDNLSTYGGSESPAWKGGTRTIARLDEERGGVSEIFIVHCPVWRLNCTVTAEIEPGKAQFRMMLVDARTGAIMDAGELLGAGHLYKNIQVQGAETYLVVGTRNVDRFSIAVETGDTCTGGVTPAPR
ncbi:MAG: hypothetical protein ACP5C4_01395 [Methanomicrobiales archaeon]